MITKGIIMTDRVLCETSVTAVYYTDYMQKSGYRKMYKNQPGLLEDGPLILYNNVCQHLGKVVTNFLNKYKWEMIPHTLYSSDMSPPDFD